MQIIERYSQRDGLQRELHRIPVGLNLLPVNCDLLGRSFQPYLLPCSIQYLDISIDIYQKLLKLGQAVARVAEREVEIPPVGTNMPRKWRRGIELLKRIFHRLQNRPQHLDIGQHRRDRGADFPRRIAELLELDADIKANAQQRDDTCCYR